MATIANSANVTPTFTNDVAACEHLSEIPVVACLSLFFEGEILSGDYLRLKKTLDKYPLEAEGIIVPVGEVSFNSPGGDVHEAMKIARLLRSRLITTRVYINQRCYSACVIAYSGGVARWAFGEIGIHSIYTPAFWGKNFTDVDSIYNAQLENLRSFYREMRLSERIVDEMLLVGHDQLKILTDEQIIALGIFGVDPLFRQMHPERFPYATQ
jgi:hypothetical protein